MQTMEKGANDVIPMPSTQIAKGRYEVIGTSRSCIVQREKVYRHMGGGSEWVLYLDGERHRTFDRKVDALRYCQVHPETVNP